MRRIIHDCDLTFGVKGCDVDDGMALMLLLGAPDVEVVGVTTSYGNNKQDVVWDAAHRFLSDLGRTDIPLYKGSYEPSSKLLGVDACEVKDKLAGMVYEGSSLESDAATFLADTARENKGEIELLVTGTTTNLLGAWLKDPEFFANLKSLTFMGGITEELVFAKGIMDEMNMSRDAASTVIALREYYEAHKNDMTPLTRAAATMTGNNCLKALFTRDEYREHLGGDTSAEKFIRERTDYWFDDNDDDWGIQGFYNWDVTSASYMLWPELFAECATQVWLTVSDMKKGYLRRRNPQDTHEFEHMKGADGDGGFIYENKLESNIDAETDVFEIMMYLPEIADQNEFRKRLYETWKNLPVADSQC